ncbi:hypothetical protein [Trueperella bialowiezensis]|uniref:Uncharacterized protein n=1 Tax=Trueperella bialowiezensis TaxID=312285 RepID=A0A448PGK6_9ACTO|nr:hypothetical protein [Trueperella bialowiezensis]VEI14101.1 Uncharacterised protein [Trueperella bialowiezensis]
MSLGAGSLNLVLPVLERLSRAPGQALVVLSAVANAILLVVGWLAGSRQSSVSAWLPFCVGLVSTGVLVFFAVRRQRLENRLDAYLDHRVEATADTPAVVIDEDGNTIPGPNPAGMKQEAERLATRDRQRAAEAESAHRKDTFMARLEAAQRAAIAAAGGIEAAPHLKDDLRWTILSAIITLVGLPVVGIFTLVAFFILF